MYCCLHWCLQFMASGTGNETLAFSAEASCFVESRWRVHDGTGLKYCIFIEDFSRDALLSLKTHWCIGSLCLTIILVLRATGVCE